MRYFTFSSTVSTTLDFTISVAPSSVNPPPAGALVVPDEFPTIQSAIDNASENGVVYVREGIYNLLR